MRLCFMIHALTAGGAERVLSELANHYARKGTHDVHLITFQPEGAPSFYPLEPSITLHQPGLNQTGPGGLSKVKRILKRLYAMRKILKTLRPHKIISFVDEMNIATLLAGLGLKIPVVISERIDPRYHNINFISKILRRFLYPFSHKLVEQGEYISSFFPYLKKRISVIPNSVLMQSSKKQFTGKLRKIITVGRLAFQKDHETLLKAYAKTREQFPDCSLDFYGEGPEKDILEALVKDLKIRDSVIFQGTAKDIQKKLLKADLFVFSSRFEGFPNALAEAMAVGLPVIASNCDGNLELVEHEKNALVFPVGDVDKLAEHLSLLMSHSKKRVQLGNAARNSIKRFAPEKIYEMWDEIIEDQKGEEQT